MKEPIKIETFIKIMTKIEKWNASCMKGYDELSEEKKNKISILVAEISNIINIIDDDSQVM